MLEADSVLWADLNFMLTVRQNRKRKRKATRAGREELLEELGVTYCLFQLRMLPVFYIGVDKISIFSTSILDVVDPQTCKNRMTYCTKIIIIIIK